MAGLQIASIAALSTGPECWLLSPSDQAVADAQTQQRAKEGA